MANNKISGFGFDPSETRHHFLINIPRSPAKTVNVYEMFDYEPEDNIKESEPGLGPSIEIYSKEKLPHDKRKGECKIELSREKWEAAKPYIELYMNGILKADSKKMGKFKIGQNTVDRLLGKEMLCFLWGIEDALSEDIPQAALNWNGFSREEKWWLYMQINAASGSSQIHRGWRKAIRFILTENPVTPDKLEKFEYKQRSFVEDK